MALLHGQDQGASRIYNASRQNLKVGASAHIEARVDLPHGDERVLESTPIVGLDSVMYFAAGNGFYALDAVTARIWKVDATRTTAAACRIHHKTQTQPAGAELMARDAEGLDAVAGDGQR